MGKEEKKQQQTYILRIAGVLIFAMAFIVLVVGLYYLHSSPWFDVVGATVFTMNTSIPGQISTSMAITLQITNPNNRVSILYDRLSASVSYQDQIISDKQSLPSIVQDDKSQTAESFTITGDQVPASPDIVKDLSTEMAKGSNVTLRLVVTGKVRFKGGPFTSARRFMFVKCDMNVSFRKDFGGGGDLLGGTRCHAST